MNTATTDTARCDWSLGHDIMVQYHDTEWGVPLHDDVKLFESIVLDGAQAGLSWLTILKRREGYRKAFDGFDIEKVASYTEADQARLLADPGIIRNRLKVASAIRNAQAALKVRDEFGSLDAYLWGFVDGTPIHTRATSVEELPAVTPLATALSKDMKKRGFNFVGPTIVYAMMQAIGMVNDHVVGCFRHRRLGGPGPR